MIIIKIKKYSTAFTSLNRNTPKISVWTQMTFIQTFLNGRTENNCSWYCFCLFVIGVSTPGGEHCPLKARLFLGLNFVARWAFYVELLCSSCASMGFSPGGPVCSLSPKTYNFLSVSKLVIGLDISVKALILCASPLEVQACSGNTGSFNGSNFWWF